MSRLRCLICLLTALMVLASFLPQCRAEGADTDSGASDSRLEARGHEGIYRAPLLNNPTTLDPAYVEDIYGLAVIQQLFDGLVRFSPDLLVVPALAENWQVEEGGKVYRFYLRKDAQFHNGRPVTSRDVIFSLGRILRVNPPPSILPHLTKISGAKEFMERKTDHVSGLEAVDDHTLIIRLYEPHVPFLIALAMYQAKIVPEAEVNGKAEQFGSHPVGSGPFRFVSWKKNESIQLRQFSNYYAGGVLLDGIEYLIYPGIQIERVWSDFQKGRLDEMPVQESIRNELKSRKDLQLVHRPSLNLKFFGFNCQHPNLKDPELRAALVLALDRQKLVDQLYDGQLQAAKGILPPGLPGYYPRERKVNDDLPAAMARLKAAEEARQGRPAPVEIVSNSQSPIAYAELNFIRDAWARLGIQTEFKFIPDWARFEEYLKSDAVQVYRYVWYADIPDPDAILQPLFFSNSQVNFMRYRNDEVDRMLQSALGVSDPVERAATYQRAEEKILESHPIFPVVYLPIDIVYQRAVQGVQVSALGAHSMSFQRVWLGQAPQ